MSTRYETKKALIDTIKSTVANDWNRMGITRVNMSALLADCKITGSRTYGYSMGISGEEFVAAIERHAKPELPLDNSMTEYWQHRGFSHAMSERLAYIASGIPNQSDKDVMATLIAEL